MSVEHIQRLAGVEVKASGPISIAHERLIRRVEFSHLGGDEGIDAHTNRVIRLNGSLNRRPNRGRVDRLTRRKDIRKMLDRVTQSPQSLLPRKIRGEHTDAILRIP